MTSRSLPSDAVVGGRSGARLVLRSDTRRARRWCVRPPARAVSSGCPTFGSRPAEGRVRRPPARAGSMRFAARAGAQRERREQRAQEEARLRSRVTGSLPGPGAGRARHAVQRTRPSTCSDSERCRRVACDEGRLAGAGRPLAPRTFPTWPSALGREPPRASPSAPLSSSVSSASAHRGRHAGSCRRIHRPEWRAWCR